MVREKTNRRANKMFISIPKEFFVPVIFSDGFILNQENDHLELDTNLYRKSSESEKYSEI